MAFVDFRDGPCSPKVEPVDDADAARGTIECGGATYTLTNEGGGLYSARVTADAGIGASNPTGIPDAGARSAWRRFLHTIGRQVPDQINASKRMRVHLRALGRR